MIKKLDGINLYASSLIRKLKEMESMQAEMIKNLHISCSNQEDENDLAMDNTPITMMVLPCTTDSENSSKETSETHLTLFSGQAIPLSSHFYHYPPTTTDQPGDRAASEPTGSNHKRRRSDDTS